MLFSGIAIATKLLNFKDFLVKNWKIVLIVVTLAAGYFYIHGLYNQIDTLKEEKQDLTVRLNDCRQNKKTLQDAINKRNAQIEKWKSVSDKLEKENSQLKDKFNQIDKETSSKVNKILSSPEIKSCDAAIDYLYNSKDDIKW